VYTGEVQQLRDGRWRTVLTASGIPVDDRRRRGGQDPTLRVGVFNNGLVRGERDGHPDAWGFDAAAPGAAGDVFTAYIEQVLREPGVEKRRP
jgi:hypothetical protein